MKTFAATSAAALLAFASTASAKVSKPFYLSAQSSNTTLNGVKFGTCHEGAAIESICIYNDDVYTFNLNTTSKNTYGTLTWNLPVGTSSGTQNVSEALTFGESYLSSNVLHPQFYPSYTGASIGFDASNRMYVPVFYDDTVTPPVYGNTYKLYNWFVCETNSAGYVSQTLDFVPGHDANVTPTNPSCQKVDVVRKFA